MTTLAVTHSERLIWDGYKEQGVNERVAYTVTVTRWGKSPTGPVFTLYNVDDPDAWVAVTASCSTGSPSVSGDVITLPRIHSLVAGSKYCLKLQFVINGNTLECAGYLKATQ